MTRSPRSRYVKVVQPSLRSQFGPYWGDQSVFRRREGWGGGLDYFNGRFHMSYSCADPRTLCTLLCTGVQQPSAQGVEAMASRRWVHGQGPGFGEEKDSTCVLEQPQGGRVGCKEMNQHREHGKHCLCTINLSSPLISLLISTAALQLLLKVNHPTLRTRCVLIVYTVVITPNSIGKISFVANRA